jgi:hypothetical protein
VVLTQHDSQQTGAAGASWIELCCQQSPHREGRSPGRREQKNLPESVNISLSRDRSVEFQERVKLLLTNGAAGLLLVLLALGLMLELRVAFWTAIGIPISILGSIALLPLTGASINMISLFGFIVTLGIVVDDAIVVGEDIFHKISEGRTASGSRDSRRERHDRAGALRRLDKHHCLHAVDVRAGRGRPVFASSPAARSVRTATQNTCQTSELIGCLALLDRLDMDKDVGDLGFQEPDRVFHLVRNFVPIPHRNSAINADMEIDKIFESHFADATLFDVHHTRNRLRCLPHRLLEFF